jgi:hypothetical protein
MHIRAQTNSYTQARMLCHTHTCAHPDAASPSSTLPAIHEDPATGMPGARTVLSSTGAVMRSAGSDYSLKSALGAGGQEVAIVSSLESLACVCAYVCTLWAVWYAFT